LNNQFSLTDKNIIITGASSGIGKQCAISCSQMGANVILIARNEERLKETYNLLDKGNHLYFSQDIKEYDKIESIISEIVSKLGKIHGFIHSAGLEMILPLKMMKPEYYENLFSINVISGFEFARIISQKKYFDSNGASFVFIASVRGFLGEPGAIGYCSSKGALISGVKVMALELINRNIRVNCVSPAIVETDMTKKLFDNIPADSKNEILKMHPMGFGKPEDIANACIFLLSDASYWITGSNLIVDGGYSAR